METKNVLHQIKGLGMRKIKLIKIVAFFLIFMCMWFAYKKYIAYNIIQNAANQPPIVFAADFYSGDAGTFKYNIETGKAEKISDYVGFSCANYFSKAFRHKFKISPTEYRNYYKNYYKVNFVTEK